MRKIRQVLRLALEEGLSQRAISTILRISRDAVSDYVIRATAAGIGCPIPVELDDVQLERLLYPPASVRQQNTPIPDWDIIHKEMKSKGATLKVLHQEYLAQQPEGIAYSQFCHLYGIWRKSLKSYMRQTYMAGERALVDYAGPTIPILNLQTGETRTAQIFVGILGASNYIYAEAHWSQKLPNWIAAHVRMFEYFGGAPQIIVCDNLKSAVIKASSTEPIVHDGYQHMAQHYGAVIVPARPKRPKDKAKAENAVLVVERWILFRLRKRVFTELSDLNAAIAELLKELNERPFQKLPGSRWSQFEAIDKPALRPLPTRAYEYTEFRRTRIGMDGRFNVDGTPYNAPYTLSGKVVDLRITHSTVEVMYEYVRVASHVRNEGTTPVINPQYISPANRHFGLWSPEESLDWSASIGLNVKSLLQTLLTASKAKEQGYRTTRALKQLHAKFGSERLESACCKAMEIGVNSISSVRSILRTGIDQQTSTDASHQEASFDHPNVRGPNYYH